jgi:catechol 2,3-dioxygenase-like lactoylglutathione lyase family enzyme
MITGVQDIYYSVTDTSKAKRFYTEVLGMKVRFRTRALDMLWTVTVSVLVFTLKANRFQASPVTLTVPMQERYAHAEVK